MAQQGRFKGNGIYRHNSDSNQLEEAVSAIIEIEQDIRTELLELCRLKQNIQSAFDAVGDETLKLLLELRYIDGLTWGQIAVKMNYSYMQIARLHGKALEEIKM